MTTGALPVTRKGRETARSDRGRWRSHLRRAQIGEAKSQADGAAPDAAFALVLPAIFLISLSLLVFEIALTRVFSVMLTYHYVFAIISAAMLGLGAGGLLFKRLARDAPGSATLIGATVFSLSLAGSLISILALPVSASPGVAGARFWLYLALALVPFGAAGFTLSGLMQRYSQRSSFAYGADLLGAAAGALVVVPAMDRLGAVNVIFLAALVAASGAVLLGLPKARRALPALAVFGLLGGLFVGLTVGGVDLKVPIATDPSKEMSGLLADPASKAQVVESRWSSFGRTDLVQSELEPNQMWVFVDGAAGSSMYNFDRILRDPQQSMEFAQHMEESVPLGLAGDDEKRSALILGPGGGRDVVVALLSGVKRITAVEVNPDVVKLVREYARYNGGIYSGLPGVDVIVGEGRNFVRTTDTRFDVIMLALPVTRSSRSVEGYALTENNLFTVEAFGDYLDHLTENGRMVIVGHNVPEIYKLVALTVEAFAKKGIPVSEAMKHLYAVGSDMMPALVIQKQPLSAVEANAVHQRLHESGFDKAPFFVPRIQQQASKEGAPMFDQSLVAVSDGALSVDTVVKAASFDLRPTTDDRPFFYKFERGLPRPFGAFAVLIGLAVIGLVVALALPGRRGAAPKGFVGALRGSARLKTYLVLFFALGVAYMLVEIAFFQKLTLYISQPQMALTVLLFSLLLGSGVGSLLTSRVMHRKLGGAAAASLCAALMVAMLSLFFAKGFALGVDPRIVATSLILPLGILMGCPFPLAVRALGAHGFEAHNAVMWGVNGGASVIGSALSMIIGITWGFSSALFAGALAYVAIAFAFVVLARTEVAVQPGRMRVRSTGGGGSGGDEGALAGGPASGAAPAGRSAVAASLCQYAEEGLR
ncbi:MAG: hypothetical protein M1337_03880 [Actinobacteria bacterium]|nr:hypothetical protein [Actinomycetota bacterium]